MAAAYRIPVRFNRTAAAFQEIQAVRARICDCESSGSDHSPEESMSMDLSDMVNFFMERDHINNIHDEIDDSDHEEIKNHKLGSTGSEAESTEELRKLMGYINEFEVVVVDPFKKKLREETERQAILLAGNSLSAEDNRRRLMVALREKGFNAGICKTKWEKSGKCPPGSYEYIDVVNKTGGIRYIIEVNLSNELTIAHPTESYNSFISNIPFIFVGKSEELKRAVRIVSHAMKQSMHEMNMSMPPWRRHAYLQSKWFGSYRRTINEFSQKTGPPVSNEVVKKRSVGFGPVPEPFEHHNCRNKFAMTGGGRMGQLAMAFNTP